MELRERHGSRDLLLYSLLWAMGAFKLPRLASVLLGIRRRTNQSVCLLVHLGYTSVHQLSIRVFDQSERRRSTLSVTVSQGDQIYIITSEIGIE